MNETDDIILSILRRLEGHDDHFRALDRKIDKIEKSMEEFKGQMKRFDEIEGTVRVTL